MAYDSKRRDQEWAQAIQQGDPEAFETLFRTYSEPLSAFAAQYVSSPEVAEEIVQDLFLEIWERRAHWTPTTNVRAYLYKTARNKALDYLKHAEVVAEWKRQAEVWESSLRSPAEELRQNELRRAIQAALAELPKRRRLIFVLSRRHGMTYREVAETLEISVKTVETQMSRAFKALRKCLAHRTSG